MENAIVQHTFLKFDHSQKTPETPDKAEKNTDLVKNPSSGNTESDCNTFLKVGGL